MTDSKFELGDLVYCPTLGTNIYKLEMGTEFVGVGYYLKVSNGLDTLLINNQGEAPSLGDPEPVIFKVNEENRNKLELEYGFKFESEVIIEIDDDFVDVDSKFKVGDLVYCPTLGTGIYTLERLLICTEDFVVRKTPKSITALLLSPEGTNFGGAVSMIFPATEENRKKLELEYGFEFEVAEVVNEVTLACTSTFCPCDDCVEDRKEWENNDVSDGSDAEAFDETDKERNDAAIICNCDYFIVQINFKFVFHGLCS